MVATLISYTWDNLLFNLELEDILRIYILYKQVVIQNNIMHVVVKALKW